jgi:hypothetical protein
VAGGLEPLENFVQLGDAGTDTLLQIDRDGAGMAESWQTLAILKDYDGPGLGTLVDQGNLDTLI